MTQPMRFHELILRLLAAFGFIFNFLEASN